ncbi:haloacid dehalogenase superfamily, subfamily IA, variant 3 with third motif having DD or ED [Pseudomonas flavescens]|uniref:Haloacid dehalogenase superfamily, subfamily IA, variant 3 with third motif having DD or ED n=1 Tax=Phytopseudomonas flavescens TaxID=29435 RepID=A0A1G8GTW5_9GAMM|nr:HAD-IA family hydrolase [Pseudomonas flavescens]SDH97731.1 haloacid dehalogenase superfamily, subfamily IA, variant 3 with third motif having DD or ED [Pseudomonas flavescens]
MQPKPPIELLICDCDGVLIDSEIIAERHLHAALAEHYPAHELDVVLAGTFGLQSRDILARVEAHFGKRLPDGFLEEHRTRIKGLIRAEVQPIEGVRDALLKIDLPLAVASNSYGDSVAFALQRCELVERVNRGAFSADQVERPKPAPDLYLLAAQSAGVDPRNCLVVEDSVTGATAALTAGMQVVGFLGASHIPPEHGETLRQLGVQHLIGRMSELPELVQRLQNGGA